MWGTYLLKLDLSQDLLRGIHLHAHQLVMWLEREQLLEVCDRLFVFQRLKVACCPSTMCMKGKEVGQRLQANACSKPNGLRRTDNTPWCIRGRVRLR